jgi:hypothetical protein
MEGAMSVLAKQNRELAKLLWPHTPNNQFALLRSLTESFAFSIARHDLTQVGGSIYVTHSGLLALARRRRCVGIRVRLLSRWCNAAKSHWIVEATVFTSSGDIGFNGLGEANTSNVHSSMHGCELRIAETRAVNRALRKAYGIGLCSIEELSSPPPTPSNGAAQKQPKPAPTLEVVSAIPLRDQLRQLIRQHQLDPALVKQYALEHCGVKNLRQATREQVSSFVKLLGERVVTNHEALVTDLQRFVINNSKDYNNQKEAA